MSATDTARTAILGNPQQADKKPARSGVVEAIGELQTQLDTTTATLEAEIETVQDNLDTAVAELQEDIEEIATIAVIGKKPKAAVRVATTVNGTFATAYANGQTVDDVVLATGDPILIKDITGGINNGIFTVNAVGAPTRRTDADTGVELLGAQVYVLAGTTNIGSTFQCSNETAPVIGTDAITWILGGKQITAIPAALDGMQGVGANIASASTTNIAAATGNVVTITGTTTINAFGTLSAGARRTLIIPSGLTIAASANIETPDGLNMVLPANSTVELVSKGAGVWRVVGSTGDFAAGVAFVNSTDKADDYIDKFGFYVDKGIEVETDGREHHLLGFEVLPGTEETPFTVVDQFGFHYDPEALTTSDDSDNLPDFLWSEEVYDAVEAIAQTEVDRLNEYDVSYLAKTSAGAILRAKTGQSFRAASDNARLFASTSYLTTRLQWQMNSYSVGPDSRCVNDGATFVTFNANTRALSTLHENFIHPTNTDGIYSLSDVAAGNYPANARGGHPDVTEEFMWQWMKRDWQLEPQNAYDTDFYTVAMNHAKTDGLASEVFLGDGLARFQSMCDVFYDAVDALNGVAPSTVGAGNTDPMLCDWIAMDHGQADEGAATADYTARVNAFGVAVQAKFLAKWGQTDLAAFTMTQVGGPKYGTAAMLCAEQQGDMMLDITTDSKNKFLVGVSWEGPNFYNVPAPHPNADDGHLTLAANAMLGIRHAVGAHYLLVREEHYWMPFPMDGYFDGQDFIIPIPSKFPPLQVSKMPYGVTMMLLDNLGITFEEADGTDNPVEFARIVPGKNYCIEGRCKFNISLAHIGKTGKRLLASNQLGFVNLRDSFELPSELPFDLPMTRNQTVYATMFADVPATNGFGRYLEDIPEFVGKPNMGNPVIRRPFAMHSVADLGV